MQSIQRVAILGVTGFVGHGLPALLAENGIATTGVSRSGNGALPGIDHWQTPETLDFSGHQAVINLAGEPIDRRWNEKNRRLFHESRVGLTRRIVAAIVELEMVGIAAIEVPAPARPVVRRCRRRGK